MIAARRLLPNPPLAPAGATGSATAGRYSDGIEALHETIRDGRRQWRIVESSGLLLTFRQCPTNEVDELPPFHRVCLLLVHEQPRERRDRVRVGAGAVHNRDAVVGVGWQSSRYAL